MAGHLGGGGGGPPGLAEPKQRSEYLKLYPRLRHAALHQEPVQNATSPPTHYLNVPRCQIPWCDFGVGLCRAASSIQRQLDAAWFLGLKTQDSGSGLVWLQGVGRNAVGFTAKLEDVHPNFQHLMKSTRVVLLSLGKFALKMHFWKENGAQAWSKLKEDAREAAE